MRLKNFVQFLNEYDDNGPMSINIAGAPLSLKNDKELEKEVDKYMDKMDEDCPRCGEAPEDCTCQEDDFWSTQNYHRTPPGDKVENEPQQNFKKDEHR